MVRIHSGSGSGLPRRMALTCTYVLKRQVFHAQIRIVPSVAADMSSRINAREDAEDLQAWLDGDHVMDDAPNASEATPEPIVDPCWRSNMLVQVLLRAGQASPTHTFVYLDRFALHVESQVPVVESVGFR